jgi:hypothetical protein
MTRHQLEEKEGKEKKRKEKKKDLGEKTKGN